MKANIILFLCLLFSSCLGQFSNAAARQKVCLYGSASSTVLTPLQLKNTDCPSNTSYCMNTVYKYDAVNWRYGGPNSLKPVSGEVAMFLTQDQQGILDYVCLLNAAVVTKMNVTVQITGAEPVPIILKDDPEGDVWRWDESQNRGSFLWNTQPAFTDGVVMGHITFTDNYCVRSSFRQTSGTGVAINKLSVFTGTVAKPTRVISVNYSPGSTFEFCQYPRTAIVSRNATCPNTNDGSATVSLVFGPPSSTYTWYNHAGDVIAQNSATVNNLAPGTYHVVVNDTSTSMGCMAERSVQIEAPFIYAPLVSTQPFSCSVKGSASVTPVGGSGSFVYEWKKGQTIIGTGPSVSNLDIGSYSVCVSDSCQSKECTTFSIETTGCCGDGICQVNEVCGSAGFCAADCAACCQPGTFKDGNSCKVCPPGSRSTTYQAESCTSCPANTNNAGGADVCADCPANTYSSAGSNKCEPCAPGTVRPAAASSCGPCPDGQYADPCGNGCVNTPSGTFAEAGAWGPSSCAPGTFSAVGQSECTPCAKGSYSGAKASSCTPCPSGTTPGVGATHALFCA